MKKKGLIVATIVMVLVLAVSLTTATYAWFTSASSTKIDAFTLSVATNNDVNIGFKIDEFYNSAATNDDFMSGAASYTASNSAARAGSVSRTAWSGGTVGLTPTIEHNIKFGKQGKAIGFSDTTLTAGTAVAGDLTSFDTATMANNAYVYAANGNGSTLTSSTLTGAVCNNDGNDTESAQKCDYVYFDLGVQATKPLTTCNLVFLIDANGSASTQVGILASLHICYNVNNTGWHDEQPFGSSTAPTAALGSQSFNMGSGAGSIAASLIETYDEYTTAPTSKTGGITIALTGTDFLAGSTITQVQVYIYIDGNDTHCTTAAVNNIQAKFSIFFNTVAVGSGS